MCLYPKLIKNPKYRSTKKNGGNIPPILDQRVKYVPIGCTRCMECKRQKANAWRVRLLEDIRTNTNAQFITLTLSNESYYELDQEINENLEGYERDNAIATLATRRFLERWRKRYKRSVRHWLVTELGHKGTENIHLHGFIWTDDHRAISEIWKYGFVWDGYNKNGQRINYVNDKTINYCIKYVNKQDLDHKEYNAKILTSPGIGANYTTRSDAQKNKFKGSKTKETYTTRTGHELSLPIYWRNKIYNEEEREKLWLQRLDKMERWVCGEKVSIKKNYHAYDALVEWHRRINKQLGYGTDEKNWERIQYEKHRRNIINETRLNKVRMAFASPAGQ